MTAPVAVITGASSGIGQSLARVLAAQGYELIIGGRREARLQALADELETPTTIITADLATARGPRDFARRVRAAAPAVDLLVNNAGVADSGRFAEADRARVTGIVNVNVRAVAEITYDLLPAMLERGSGRILNVASVVSFSAVPGMAAYGASKAFVLSFSEALAEEVRHSGVTVTALCPGLTKTEMVDDLHGDLLGDWQLPEQLMADPDDVARKGVAAAMRGQALCVPGVANQAFVNWLELQPRWLARSLAGVAMRSADAWQTLTTRQRSTADA
ncbi:MAG: SDR family oxidoreductase [Pseudomonadota bacterium]